MIRQKILVLEYGGLIIYTLLVAILLVLFGFSHIAITFWMIVLPTAFLWYRADLRSRLLPVGILLGFFVMTLLQLYAYRYGLWYELTAASAQLWLVPLPSLWFGIALLFYYVVVYEYFFDDQTARVRTDAVARSLFATISVIAVLVGYLWVFPIPLVPLPFMILLGVLLLGLFLLIRMQQTADRVQLFKRCFLFSVAIFPLSLIFELVHIFTSTRFYANTPEYLHVVSLGSVTFPLESLFLMIIAPLWVVFMYELVLDDAK